MEDLLRQVRNIELRARRMVDSTFAGEYHSAFKGKGLEFDEVRPYQVGDDVRSIDWNVTARNGRPFIKVFREERELSLCILFDISASNEFGQDRENKRKIGTELAAILALSALKNQDKVGLALCSDYIEHYIPPQKGRKHVLKLIRLLLTLEPHHPNTDLQNALVFLHRILKQRGIVVVISDFLDQNFSSALIQLSKKQEIILVHLYHPGERFEGLSGIFPAQNLETGANVWIRSTRRRKENRREDFFTFQQKHLSQVAAKHQMGYISIDTTQDYVPVLERYFRERPRKNY